MGFLRVLFLLSLATAIASGRLGTLNGYDREGGSDPICWQRALNASSSIDVGNYSVEFLRDLRDSLVGADADMLDECHRGLTMNVTLQADVSARSKCNAKI